jgi:hypothetical protein
MMSYPVKGDPSNDFAGGANPAELAWYFLIASIDSGFGYYDENVGDGVKPTISFNQSLHFSRPYVEANLSKDRTGPSIWWPQRYPYNPGSANKGKAEGWSALYANNVFAIYTYAYDASGMEDIKVKIRVHADPLADASDKTFKLYDPAAHASDPEVDPSRVGDWVGYDMNERDLSPDINGVSWQPSSTATFQVVPAQVIGNLYYAYLDQYRGQLLDYYIEAMDKLGNVTKSPVQQVYVGLGRFKMEGGKQVEDLNGDIEGAHPCLHRPTRSPQRDAVCPSRRARPGDAAHRNQRGGCRELEHGGAGPEPRQQSPLFARNRPIQRRGRRFAPALSAPIRRPCAQRRGPPFHGRDRNRR